MARTAVSGRLSWLVATVKETRDETATARTLSLDVPGWPGHLAGQHVTAKLTAEDGYSTQRDYSIASAPEPDRFELTVQRLADGEVSPYLTGVAGPGDQLEVRGPIGGWFAWQAADPRPLLLLAGGSGVVPLMSMIRTHAEAGSQVPVRLIYSARTPADVIYQQELSERVRVSPLTVSYLYTRTLYRPASAPQDTAASGPARRAAGSCAATATAWTPAPSPRWPSRRRRTRRSSSAARPASWRRRRTCSSRQVTFPAASRPNASVPPANTEPACTRRRSSASRYAATPSSSLLPMTCVAAASTAGCALATAQEVPAQASSGRSLGMSPNAMTDCAPDPVQCGDLGDDAGLGDAGRGGLDEPLAVGMGDADQAVEDGKRQGEQVVAAVAEVPAEQFGGRPGEQRGVVDARHGQVHVPVERLVERVGGVPVRVLDRDPDARHGRARSAAAAAASAGGAMRCRASIAPVRMS